MVKINSKLINIRDFLNVFYPVGSYYETSDTSFNPNTTWGGTWVEDTAGRTTVAYDSTQTEFDTIGETGGEKTHTLTRAEMPDHAHGIATNGGSGISVGYNYQSPGGWNSAFCEHAGGDQPHNNLQPYIVVKRWHRTA